jgi:hypothetical protein
MGESESRPRGVFISFKLGDDWERLADFWSELQRDYLSCAPTPGLGRYTAAVHFLKRNSSPRRMPPPSYWALWESASPSADEESYPLLGQPYAYFDPFRDGFPLVPELSLGDIDALLRQWHEEPEMMPPLHDSPLHKPTPCEARVTELSGAESVAPPPEEPGETPELTAEQILFLVNFIRQIGKFLLRRWLGCARHGSVRAMDIPGVDHSTESHRSRAPGRARKTSSMTVFRELAPI